MKIHKVGRKKRSHEFFSFSITVHSYLFYATRSQKHRASLLVAYAENTNLC